MNILPFDLINYIYLYDSTYKLKYDNCITELNKKINQYNMIMITFNNVRNIDKIYFKRFNPIFYQYILQNN